MLKKNFLFFFSLLSLFYSHFSLSSHFLSLSLVRLSFTLKPSLLSPQHPLSASLSLSLSFSLSLTSISCSQPAKLLAYASAKLFPISPTTISPSNSGLFDLACHHLAIQVTSISSSTILHTVWISLLSLAVVVAMSFGWFL